MTAIRALLEVTGAPRLRKKVQSDLAQLADSWDRLAAGSGSPLHHYAWVSACAETFAATTELQVVVVGTPQRPVAMAPLIMRRSRFPRLELLGARELHEPTDLVYKNPAEVTAQALAGALAQLDLPLFLERVPAESSTVSAVKQVWRSRGVVICRPALGCPWIELN